MTASFKAAWRAGAVMLAVAASAAVPAQEIPSENWQYEAGPTLWATSLSGYLRPSPRAPVAHFNSDFSDMRLNAAVFSFEAGKGRWGVLAELYGIDQSQASDPLQHGQDGKSVPDGSHSLVQLAGLYRLSFDPATHFDLLAGIRYSSLDMDVTQPQELAPFSCAKCSHNEHWTDVIAGFRVQHKLADHWWLDAYGDYGSGDSKSTWQARLGATYQIDDGISAKFGYRILSTDYETNQLLYNLKTSGLYAGISMRF
jgi:opacity protein-like surface antigen